MPSRINIGPEDGPYVAINENNGDIELQDNTGAVVAKWDDGQSQWDFVENDISGVGAFDSESVNTESIEIGGRQQDYVLTEDANSPGDIDGEDSIDVTLDNPIGNHESLLIKFGVEARSSVDVTLAFNGETSRQAYRYETIGGASVSDDTEIVLAESARHYGGTIVVGNHGGHNSFGITMGRRQVDGSSLAISGGRDRDSAGESIDSIQMTIDADTDGAFGGFVRFYKPTVSD